MRTFNTGATRGSEEDKLDYEGFISPLALKRYAEYLHKHRIQEDGNLRDSDNWQKGIPFSSYMKSLLRHVMNVWLNHRSHISGVIPLLDESMEDSLCAVIFNAQGYLHELEKEEILCGEGAKFPEMTDEIFSGMTFDERLYWLNNQVESKYEES
ncbi:hypothetical protein LCGC14_2328020 [marine sediment metagenome]|uniref:dATP/dGTP diphosphohydrolase N-terminal domain-containing protein n=1 Tax=marine sediment metagenome TaxID=412755 RepID=A0A0F9CFP8_9ZZZZ